MKLNIDAYDVLIVGSGFCGSVLARKLAEDLGKRVCIVERRSHIAGNMYDEVDKNGILVQKYGPHTFHTNNKTIFDFISKYGEWINYDLICRAVVQGKVMPTPFNFTSIDLLYDASHARELKERLLNVYQERRRVTILELLESKDDLIREYAITLFEEDYRPYTAKQWGMEPDKIDDSILKRVPVVLSYQDGYFVDTYQCMPKNGFTQFFRNLLNHPKIDIYTDINALDIISIDLLSREIRSGNRAIKIPVVYTGAIDELLDYKYGVLPYRSLAFKSETYMIDSFQEAPVVAHPKAEGFTRITEYKKIPIQSIKGVTTIVTEYPTQYDKVNEPYYPVLTKESDKLYKAYYSDVLGIENLFLCGRLADYKYYNMDNAVERALTMFEKIKYYLNIS